MILPTCPYCAMKVPVFGSLALELLELSSEAVLPVS